MLVEIFSYTFLVRAFVVGLMVSLCASLLGVSLVLKRYSMIGDGLSRVGFCSLALATALNLAPLALSIPIVILAAFLLLRLSEQSKIKGDAAIALISTSSLAIGVIVLSLTTGMNTDVCNFMFGSILVMKSSDVTLSIALSTGVLTLFVLFYNKIFAVTFDENYAKATGTNTEGYNMLVALLTAITIVLGMRMMGALLISSLIIFPALTSMRLFKCFRSVIISSALISVVCFVIGMMASYEFATPTGASVVLVNMVVFVIFSLINIMRGVVKMKKILAMTLLSVFIFAGCNSTIDKAEPVNSAGTQAVTIVDDNSTMDETADSKENEKSISEGDDGSLKDDKTTGITNVVSGDVIEIKEKMFVAQTNDIYVNTDEYLGKIIKYEGFLNKHHAEELNKDFYFVVRNGPGCCGNDSIVGFEVVWDGEFPKVNEWVEISGVLESYDEDGDNYIRIALESLTVLDVRGEETVYQ